MTPAKGQLMVDEKGRMCLFEAEERYGSTHGVLICWLGLQVEPRTKAPYHILLEEKEWKVLEEAMA